MALMKRNGYTLVEAIVVFAIMSIMIALLLGSVQKVRQTARRVVLQNQIRQLSLAVIQIEGNRGLMPIQFEYPNRADSLTVALMSHFDYNTEILSRDVYSRLPAFVNLSDPSYGFFPDKPSSIIQTNDNGNVSFGFNYLVFETRHNVIDDGRSNTVMCGERYARCGRLANVCLWMGPLVNQDEFGNLVPATLYSVRSAYFADKVYSDVVPVFVPATRTSHGSVPGLTFQSLPRPDVCDPRILQASTTSGLVVALMDGSVRTISPSVAPAVYWSSMTPDKGEVVNLD